MFFYLSAEVYETWKAIIFENNARMVCIYPFFVVPLRSLEDYAQFTHNTRTIHGQ